MHLLWWKPPLNAYLWAQQAIYVRTNQLLGLDCGPKQHFQHLNDILVHWGGSQLILSLSPSETTGTTSQEVKSSIWTSAVTEDRAASRRILTKLVTASVNIWTEQPGWEEQCLPRFLPETLSSSSWAALPAPRQRNQTCVCVCVKQLQWGSSPVKCF